MAGVAFVGLGTAVRELLMEALTADRTSDPSKAVCGDDVPLPCCCRLRARSLRRSAALLFSYLSSSFGVSLCVTSRSTSLQQTILGAHSIKSRRART